MSRARPFHPRWPVVLAVLALGLGGCKPPSASGDFAVRLRPDPSPARIGTNRFTLTLTRPDGRPLVGARVRVEVNMTHAGMIPLHVVASTLGGGRYAMQPIDFAMAGDSVMTVTAEIGGRTLTADASFEVLP